MSSFAQLEADLFLAERAFKRVPSEQNKLALDKVKEAIESFGSEPESSQSNPPVPTPAPKDKAKPAPKAPAKPKATTPKAPKAQKTAAATPEANTTEEDSKKK